MLFPLMMQFVIDGEESKQKIPPPYADAVLSLIVHLVITGEAPSWISIPPPYPDDVLALMMQFVIDGEEESQ